MPIGRGSKTSLVLDFEDDYGEDPETESGLLLPVNFPINLQGKQAKNKPNRASGSRNPRKPFAGNFDVSGSLVIPVDYSALWYWLKLIFGAPTTSGAGPYVHTFKIGDTQPSAVLDEQIANITQYWKYNGIMVSQFGLEIGGDGELVMNLTLIGSDETPGSSPYSATPTAITEHPLYNFQAAVKEGGSAYADMTTFKMDVNLGLDTSFRPIGALGKIKEVMEGDVSISGTFTAAYRDNALVDKGVAGTKTSLQHTITSGTNILDIKLAEVEYERPGKTVNSGMGIFQDVPYQAYYENDAAASAIVVTLTNGDAHA